MAENAILAGQSRRKHKGFGLVDAGEQREEFDEVACDTGNCANPSVPPNSLGNQDAVIGRRRISRPAVLGAAGCFCTVGLITREPYGWRNRRIESCRI